MNNLNLEQIEMMIYTIKGQKVMLDSDLAKLYGVETKVLNQAVKRNKERFPDDFMFQCYSDDLVDLRSQFVTSNPLSYWNHKKTSKPYLFTENGVAMLSSILKSKQAIEVNISIIRIFTKLRSFLFLDNQFDKTGQFQKDTKQLFKIVFERLDKIKNTISPTLPQKRKKIGINDQDDRT